MDRTVVGKFGDRFAYGVDSTPIKLGEKLSIGSSKFTITKLPVGYYYTLFANRKPRNPIAVRIITDYQCYVEVTPEALCELVMQPLPARKRKPTKKTRRT